VLDKFNGEDVLLYLDPPYYLDKNYYNKEETFNHIELSEQLKQLKKAKFILSYNSNPEVKELYKGFYYDERDYTKFSSRAGDSKPNMCELLIYNFPIKLFDKTL